MKLTGLALAALLAAAVPLQSSDLPSPAPPLSNPETPSLTLSAPEPLNAPLLVGDRAPDFSWQADDARPLKLRDLLAQGNLFVVFGAQDAVLRALERERTTLLDLGVVPVAVVSSGNRGSRSTANRLGLHYVLVPDSRRVIAAQYGVIEDVNQTIAPAWFVVDRTGCVRALKRGALPASGYARLAADVLALPTGDVNLPAHAH